jgi:hypothetical protein
MADYVALTWPQMRSSKIICVQKSPLFPMCSIWSVSMYPNMVPLHWYTLSVQNPKDTCSSVAVFICTTEDPRNEEWHHGCLFGLLCRSAMMLWKDRNTSFSNAPSDKLLFLSQCLLRLYNWMHYPHLTKPLWIREVQGAAIINVHSTKGTVG